MGPFVFISLVWFFLQQSFDYRTTDWETFNCELSKPLDCRITERFHCILCELFHCHSQQFCIVHISVTVVEHVPKYCHAFSFWHWSVYNSLFFSFNFFLVYMYGQNLGQEKKHNMCWKLWHRLVAFSKLCNSYLQQIHIERCKLNKPKCDLLHELHTSSVCFCHLLPWCPCSNQFSPAWKDGL